MSEYLSDIELYFAPSADKDDEEIILSGEECRHLLKVMRHKPGDVVHVTDGKGTIYLTKMLSFSGDRVNLQTIKTHNYNDKFQNITFCLPKLKNSDRFGFMLEKAAELGITSFIIYQAERSITKAEKFNRWQKILISAMKQSLLSYLPSLQILDGLDSVAKLSGEKILFDQTAEKNFTGYRVSENQKYFFIFGPEGGLNSDELKLFDPDNFYKLAENRLRTETAVIKCAAML